LDVDISNAERAQMMNAAMVDCRLRIHADGNDNPAVHGVSMLAPARGTMNTTDASAQVASLELANALLAPVVAATGTKKNGVALRSDQTGFTWSAVPVCTVEIGYMTNEREDWLLVTNDYQDKILDGLAQGFVNYFK